MSQNLRIIFDNVHDRASLTATTNALPIAYTQRSGRSYAWRSTNLNQQRITATLMPATYLDSLVIYQHNLSVGARVRFEALLGGSVVADTGFRLPSEIKPLGEWVVGVDPWGTSNLAMLPVRQFVIWLPEITLCDSYRITIQDPQNPDGYMQIGRIFSGQYYSPENNAVYGMGFENEEFVDQVRTAGKSLRSVGEGSARVVSFDLDMLKKTGMEDLALLLMTNSKRKEVYVNMYPEQGGVTEAIYAFVAKRRSNFSQTNNYFNNWANSHVFEEA